MSRSKSKVWPAKRAAGAVPPGSSSKPPQPRKRDPELAREMLDFDLLGRIQRDTGERGVPEGSCITFHSCPVCGHHDCLRYYPHASGGHEGNTYFCFDSNRGGDALSYLMEVGFSYRDAQQAVAPVFSAKEATAYRNDSRGYAGALAVPSKAAKKILDADVAKLASLHADTYPLDEKSYSRLFGLFAHGSVRWLGEERAWRCWTGKNWRLDDGGDLVNVMAKRFSDALLEFAYCISDDSLKAKFVSWSCRYLKANNRKTLVSDARCELIARLDEFDQDPYLFNCRNTTLDIRTLKTHPHNPEDMITFCAPVTYDPGAKCDEFLGVVRRSFAGDSELMRYLQKVLGLGLVGLSTTEKMWFLHGQTRSGKGTIMTSVTSVLGTDDEGYARTAQAEVLAIQRKDARAASPQLARLSSCRLVSMSEPDKHMSLDVGLVKQLTGGDEVTARHLNQGLRGFVPHFCMVMMCNSLPMVTDMTLFDSDRVCVVPFKHQVPEGERDEKLKGRLCAAASRSGILNWLLDGYAAAEGEGLEMPDCVLAETSAYERNSDKLDLFLSECLVSSADQNVKASDVYDAYRDWCNDSGLHAEGKKKFFAGLRAKGLMSDRGSVSGIPCKNVILGHALDVD